MSRFITWLCDSALQSPGRFQDTCLEEGLPYPLALLIATRLLEHSKHGPHQLTEVRAMLWTAVDADALPAALEWQLMFDEKSYLRIELRETTFRIRQSSRVKTYLSLADPEYLEKIAQAAAATLAQYVARMHAGPPAATSEHRDG